jgi:hypothetical protein
LPAHSRFLVAFLSLWFVKQNSKANMLPPPQQQKKGKDTTERSYSGCLREISQNATREI